MFPAMRTLTVFGAMPYPPESSPIEARQRLPEASEPASWQV
jgi:hypothetical protein